MSTLIVALLAIISIPIALVLVHTAPYAPPVIYTFTAEPTFESIHRAVATAYNSYVKETPLNSYSNASLQSFIASRLSNTSATDYATRSSATVRVLGAAIAVGEGVTRMRITTSVSVVHASFAFTRRVENSYYASVVEETRTRGAWRVLLNITEDMPAVEMNASVIENAYGAQITVYPSHVELVVEPADETKPVVVLIHSNYLIPLVVPPPS